MFVGEGGYPLENSSVLTNLGQKLHYGNFGKFPDIVILFPFLFSIFCQIGFWGTVFVHPTPLHTNCVRMHT